MKTQKEINDLTYEIIGACISVHRILGPGLYEDIYEECMYRELTGRKLRVVRQQEVPFIYNGKKMDSDFKLDLLVEDTAIIEIKAAEIMLPEFDAEILTYMKLLQKPKGIIANFFCVNMKSNCKHFTNEYFKMLPLE